MSYRDQPDEYEIVARDRRPATPWLADITGDVDHEGIFVLEFVRALTPRAIDRGLRRLRRRYRKTARDLDTIRKARLRS